MDWELLKKIDPTKLLSEGSSPIDLITGEKEKTNYSKDKCRSGLYYKKPAYKYDPDKGINCKIEFFEAYHINNFEIGLLKSITIGTAERYFAEACKYLVKNKHQKAINRLGEVLNKDPQYTDAYFLMGCIFMEMSHFDKANSCFQKVLLCQKSLGKDFKKYLPSFHVTLNLNVPYPFCIFPELLGATLLTSASYWENNKKEEALLALDQADSIFPKNSAVLYLITLFKLELTKYNDIISYLSNLEPSNSLDLSTYTLLGVAYYSINDSSTAIQLLRNGLKYAERFEDEEHQKIIRYYLGKAYLLQGDKFEGLQELKKVSNLDFNYLDTNLLLQDPNQGAMNYKKETLLKKEDKYIEPIIEADNLPNADNVQKSSDNVILQNIQENVKLILEKTGEEFPINIQLETTIGREDINTLSFPDDFSISRRQAKITYEGASLWIEDMESTNGTYLNKRRVTKKMQLKNKDEIQMGKKVFTIFFE